MEKRVIIIYENTVREYDNALLLEAELTNRGYNVELLHKTHFLCWRKRKAIVLIPNSYNTNDLETYAYWLNCNEGIYINLQYEQIFSERVKSTGFVMPAGKAKNILHLCWGEDRYKELINEMMAPKNLLITGALQLDFLREEFDGFYLDRSTVASRYNLDINKRWLLFISSFTYTDSTFIEKNAPDEFYKDDFIWRFSRLSIKSQKEVLRWFEVFIQNNSDILIVYRKHPSESDSVVINDLKQKYSTQFYDISDLSVKQWIKTCDICTTWFSTSASEIYMAHKPFYLLRPFPIDHEFDVPFYYDADSIKSYEEFELAVTNLANSRKLPISEGLLKQYYMIDEIPAYVKVADAVDNAFASGYEKNVLGDVNFEFHRWLFLLKNVIFVKYMIKIVYQFVYYHFGFQIRGNLRNTFAFSEWEADIKHQKDKINIEKRSKIEKIVFSRKKNGNNHMTICSKVKPDIMEENK